MREHRRTPLGQYLSDLENRIDQDADFLRLMVGYSVIEALEDFHICTSSEKEFAYRQAKAIYDSLSTTLRACRNGQTVERLNDLRQIGDITRNENNLSLLNQIIEKSQGLDEEYVLQFGSRIMKYAQYTGRNSRNKKNVLADYNHIKEVV